jgi:hypothetical protein
MDDVQNELDKINGSKADAIKKIALMFKWNKGFKVVCIRGG